MKPPSASPPATASQPWFAWVHFYDPHDPYEAPEPYRARAAADLGVAVEEVAFTRGATEALMTLINGYNRLKPGDAVLYADLDYDSTQSAFEWRKTHRGVDVVRIALPEPATHQNLIDAYEAAQKNEKPWLYS